MNEPAGGRWSIAERATWWFALTTLVVVLGIAAFAAREVYRSKERMLASLVLEELSELRARFERPEEASERVRSFDERRNEFADIVDELRADHARNPMAFRVWDVTSGKRLGDFGAVELFRSGEPLDRVTEHDVVLPGRLHSSTERFPSGVLVGAVVSGRADHTDWLQFVALSALLALVSGIGAYASGKYFIRKACAYMHQLAVRASAVRDSREEVELDPGDAPREIVELVGALGTMLRNIREEQDRTRLLTAGLAHELGSPLQNLIGETEVALMGEKPGAEYKRVLESHLEELRDIGHAVGNLMTLVSIQQSGPSRDAETFDLGAEAAVRLRRERSHAQRRGVTLDVDSGGDLTLFGDREALWLAVSNLVANAIDYSNPNGHVKLTIDGAGEDVRVTVDDDGPGVPEDQREKIFEPFYRGPTTKGRRAGYGLGLSIAKKAVDTHGGSLVVERAPIGGARFRIVLPRRRVSHSETALAGST